MSETDRIQKKVVLRAPRARVWRALADHEQFGKWFHVALEGPFRPGAVTRGKVQHPNFKDVAWEMTVEEMVPEKRFSFRWHPFAVDQTVDYSKEPTTLVVLELDDAPGGTLLTLTESGFDGVPLARRAKAFEMNAEGWGQVMQSIERDLSSGA
jgi:uncharacterized protein YndB with AHSA1/START domain